MSRDSGGAADAQPTRPRKEDGAPRGRGGFRYAAAGHAGGLLLDALLATTRTETVNPDAFERHHAAGRSVVFALWHGWLLPPTWHHRGQRIVTLASRSADGEYITRVLAHWGYHVVRGSSSRGGDSALRELVRLLRAGRSVAITCDGPRGPRQKLKFGVLQMAQLSGAPIIPVGSAANRSWQLNSWDRFTVPKPFARLRVSYGDGLIVPRDLPASRLPEMAAQVERAIADQTQAAGAPFT
jgi:lysophospholipid acyltransferase (LPLAT)-like uncharacterized protein